jgi:hypothetical protein
MAGEEMNSTGEELWLQRCVPVTWQAPAVEVINCCVGGNAMRASVSQGDMR